MIEFGTKVRDKITGFEGTVVARDQWQHSGSRVGVQSEGLHDGKPIPIQWIDVERVEVVA